MKINIVEQDTTILFSVKGYLDTTTSSKFEEVLSPYLEGEKNFLFDFAELEYVSSAGLRVILRTAQTMEDTNRTISVRNSNEEVLEVFGLTGFDEFLILE